MIDLRYGRDGWLIEAWILEGNLSSQQKRTDLLLGLDFAMMSAKRQISHAAVVAGDSDFLPAFKAAKQEGVSVWLFHGPGRSTGRDSSYADELWQAADERYELTAQFLERIKL